MRSCSMALGLLSTALGSYLAGALTYAVQVRPVTSVVDLPGKNDPKPSPLLGRAPQVLHTQARVQAPGVSSRVRR
jgi:hypothetical protein